MTTVCADLQANTKTRCTHKGDLLRIVLCGSVDDGKSTLLGRLLYDAGLLHKDQLTTLAVESQQHGSSTYDFSLLLDGLMAEREQKITIDVAYRFFASTKRRFIVADTPGHPQYTGNMLSGASTADVAIVIVDARKGVLTQTRRHTRILALMAIQPILLVVNKMDLVNYEQSCFEAIVNEFYHYAHSLGMNAIHSIPVSALLGDNLVSHAATMPWYQGAPLLSMLENLPLSSIANQEAFAMAVQWVNRPHADFRGFSGQIAAGELHSQDEVMVLPSGQKSRVERIVSFDGDYTQAVKGQSITVTLADAIDISRGDLLTCANNPCELADEFNTDIIWLHKSAMVPGRHYQLKIGTAYLACTIDKPLSIVSIDHLEPSAQNSELRYNDLAHAIIRTERVIGFLPYLQNRALGAFLICDKITYDILGAGIIRSGYQRRLHIPEQALSVNQTMRAAIKLQRPQVFWFTGLSSAGKSTLANLFELKLHQAGYHTVLLDANNLRHGLNDQLGFTAAERIENIRRIAEVAKLMLQAGLIVLVACIAPMASERKRAAELIGETYYTEIYVDASLAIAESRDTRGLYKKARAGEIDHFTGISSPYEIPLSPDIHINTNEKSPEEAIQLLMQWFTHHQSKNTQ